MRGVVFLSAQGPQPLLESQVLQMRTLHHVSRLIGRFELQHPNDLTTIEQAVAEAPLDELSLANSFRASCNRVGQHDFDSYAVMVATGKAVQERFGTPVDLKGYDLDVRVDVYELEAWLGLQLTRKPLSHRFEGRPYLRRASLKSSVAYVLLQIAQITPESNGVLLDPFCGAGTILLETGQLFPHLHLWGSDMHLEPVAGTETNLALFGLQDRLSAQQVDARTLVEHYAPHSVDYLVTNPPYGLRMGHGIDIGVLYRRFLDGAKVVLKPEGTLVMLVLKAATLRAALKASGDWRVDTHARLEIGGKMLTAFRLRLSKPA